MTADLLRRLRVVNDARGVFVLRNGIEVPLQPVSELLIARIEQDEIEDPEPPTYTIRTLGGVTEVHYHDEDSVPGLKPPRYQDEAGDWQTHDAHTIRQPWASDEHKEQWRDYVTDNPTKQAWHEYKRARAEANVQRLEAQFTIYAVLGTSDGWIDMRHAARLRRLGAPLPNAVPPGEEGHNPEVWDAFKVEYLRLCLHDFQEMIDFILAARSAGVTSPEVIAAARESFRRGVERAEAS